MQSKQSHYQPNVSLMAEEGGGEHGSMWGRGGRGRSDLQGLLLKLCMTAKSARVSGEGQRLGSSIHNYPKVEVGRA